MAGRLGSSDLVNTIVIAHPATLKPAQIQAIKVNLLRKIPSHDFTYYTCLLRSLLLGRWPKVKKTPFLMYTTSFITHCRRP